MCREGMHMCAGRVCACVQGGYVHVCREGMCMCAGRACACVQEGHVHVCRKDMCMCVGKKQKQCYNELVSVRYILTD